MIYFFAKRSYHERINLKDDMNSYELVTQNDDLLGAVMKIQTELSISVVV